MDDLFFPVPSDVSYDPLMDAYAYKPELESVGEPVIAQRNPVADLFLSTVYGFKASPASTEWLLNSGGWTYMPEADRDGFVAAIIEVYPNEVDAIQTLYMNAFERLGEPEGLAYWTLHMLHDKTTDPSSMLLPIINSSPEYVGMLKTVLGDPPALANLKTGQEIENYIRIQDGAARVDMYGKLVDHLYDNVLGRVAEPGGKAYWTGELEKGSVNLLQIMGAIVNGSGAADKTLLSLKGDIAYDAISALIDHNIITNQDIAKAGAAKVGTALANMQERLSEYDATELLALQANRETLITQMLRDAGLV